MTATPVTRWAVMVERRPTTCGRLSFLAFAGRCGVDGECMDAALDLGLDRVVDHAVAGDPGLASKGFRHDINPIVGLSARTVPGMALMLAGFIQNFQTFRREGCGQLLDDDIFRLHAGSLNGNWRARSMAAIEAARRAACAGSPKSSLEGAARTSE